MSKRNLSAIDVLLIAVLIMAFICLVTYWMEQDRAMIYGGYDETCTTCEGDEGVNVYPSIPEYSDDDFIYPMIVPLPPDGSESLGMDDGRIYIEDKDKMIPILED